jgi:nitrite reductase/ring-hydroxylating ferredoxin subunit
MPDRRSFLTATGLATLAVATGLDVAGCSTPTPAAPQVGTTSSAAGGAGEKVDAASVPVGSGVVAGAYIVTQPTAGTFKAYSNVCPHQGCAVSIIQGAQVKCPCHGSVYSLADGSKVSGPTPSGLGPAKASLSGTTVTVSA